MNKKLTALMLAGIMAVSVCGCSVKSSGKEDTPVKEETEASEEAQKTQEEPSGILQAGEAADSETETFSFADLKNLDFWFSSGAGAWATLLRISEDGSFSGEFHDSDMGVTGEGYPNGTRYLCNFIGQFTQPVKVNEYTYSIRIREMKYEQEVGREEILDGVLYCYSDAYGLDGAEELLIYLPGAPLAELPEEYRSWVGYYDLSDTAETELPFYGIYNEAEQEGFSGSDVVENIKQSMVYAEEQSKELETSLEEEMLTQGELNEKAQQLYELWDGELNEIWSVLKRTKDEEAMRALTDEERQWIASKEAAADEACAEYKGGSMYSMVRDLKAAELTKARVYELLELLD